MLRALWLPKFSVLRTMPEIIQLSGSHTWTRKLGLELESIDEGGEVDLVLSQGYCSGESSQGRATSRTSC